MTVTAATNKASYGPEEKPVLTLKVTNGGKLPCKVNIGTSQMEFLVTSGSDRIFSSGDCQASSNDLVKTIAPGKSETANFPWSAQPLGAGLRENLRGVRCRQRSTTCSSPSSVPRSARLRSSS